MLERLSLARTVAAGALGFGLLVPGGAAAQVPCDHHGVAYHLPRLPEGCQHERISAAGHERPTRIWALNSAGDSWQDQVLTKYGERFTRWEYAACAKTECVPAAVPGFTRCTLTGYPCASPPTFHPNPPVTAELSYIEVQEMQRLLGAYGFHVVVDGVFGGQTSNALRRWQRSRGVYPDGLPSRANLELLRRGRA